MKIFLSIVTIFFVTTFANAQKDNRAFRAYLYNNEYEVYMRIDFYDESIVVPEQELYGELPGYLGKKNNPFCWVITRAIVKDERTAELSMINDYGSEDLTATLTRKNDSIYVLKQVDGSALKVPAKGGKWQKLPKTIEFKKK